MGSLETVRWGREALRVGPWRGKTGVAIISPVATGTAPTAPMVAHCCRLLRSRGYCEVITGALSSTEQEGFRSAGFALCEELHLLRHDLSAIPAPSSFRLRRARRSDQIAVISVDTLAFAPFWRMDGAGLGEALGATPSSRFRVAEGAHGEVIGYAITGRGGRQGYLQRLAVHPSSQRDGLGRALVIDGLRWLERRRATHAVVNTQIVNEGALRLYLSLGFRLQTDGLAVLSLRLEDRESAS